MSAIIMLTSAGTAVTACVTATTAATAASLTGPLYGGGMAVTSITTIPAIVTAITIFQGILAPSAAQAGWPAKPLDPLMKIKIDDCVQILIEDIPAIAAAIGTATVQSIALNGAPSTSFPNDAADVVTKFGDLSSFITDKFVTPLTF